MTGNMYMASNSSWYRFIIGFTSSQIGFTSIGTAVILISHSLWSLCFAKQKLHGDPPRQLSFNLKIFSWSICEILLMQPYGETLYRWATSSLVINIWPSHNILLSVVGEMRTTAVLAHAMVHVLRWNLWDWIVVAFPASITPMVF